MGESLNERYRLQRRLASLARCDMARRREGRKPVGPSLPVNRQSGILQCLATRSALLPVRAEVPPPAQSLPGKEARTVAAATPMTCFASAAPNACGPPRPTTSPLRSLPAFPTRARHTVSLPQLSIGTSRVSLSSSYERQCHLPLPWFGDSHVRFTTHALSVHAPLARYSSASHLPARIRERLSPSQDSKTDGVLPANIVTSDLIEPVPDHTHHAHQYTSSVHSRV